jgi:hypothetical protein
VLENRTLPLKPHGASGALGSDGHAVMSFTNGVVTLESSRYPFSFSGGAR